MPWWSPRSSLRRFGDLRRTEVATFAGGCFWGVEVQSTIGSQGFDIGEHYRTAVFTHKAE
jgi:peptide methionine sulfoxide reductase MsrA